MTTDFRALCAELADELHDFQWAVQEAGVGWACPDTESLIDRARAALAEPEPVGPTNAEIHAVADELLDGDSASRVDFARAVLARWGQPS